MNEKTKILNNSDIYEFMEKNDIKILDREILLKNPDILKSIKNLIEQKNQKIKYIDLQISDYRKSLDEAQQDELFQYTKSEKTKNKIEKGKTNYQAQINTLEKQFYLAKNLKEKSEISKKIREIEIKAAGENINVNLPEIAKYEPFQQIIPEKKGNNYKIKIDGVEIPNILISKDGTKTRLEKYGIDVFWDKNANNKKGRLKFIRLNKPLKKENKSNEKNQIIKGKVGNIKYSIEKQ